MSLEKLLKHIEADEEIGSVDELNWYGFINISTPSKIKDFINYLEDVSEKKITQDDKDELSNYKAIILIEDQQGFNSYEGYESLEDAEDQWRSIQEDYEKFYEEQET